MKLVVWMAHRHLEQHAASVGEVVGGMWQQSCCFRLSLEPLSPAIGARGQSVGPRDMALWQRVCVACHRAVGSTLKYASPLPSQEEEGQISCF